MKRIFMQPWLEANERKRTYDTDIWYVNLANKLLPVVEKSPPLSSSEGDTTCANRSRSQPLYAGLCGTDWRLDDF